MERENLVTRAVPEGGVTTRQGDRARAEAHEGRRAIRTTRKAVEAIVVIDELDEGASLLLVADPVLTPCFVTVTENFSTEPSRNEGFPCESYG